MASLPFHIVTLQYGHYSYHFKAYYYIAFMWDSTVWKKWFSITPLAFKCCYLAFCKESHWIRYLQCLIIDWVASCIAKLWAFKRRQIDSSKQLILHTWSHDKFMLHTAKVSSYWSKVVKMTCSIHRGVKILSWLPDILAYFHHSCPACDILCIRFSFNLLDIL